MIITVCKPLYRCVVNSRGICVNCGGKGGTPGPCKTSFGTGGPGSGVAQPFDPLRPGLKPATESVDTIGGSKEYSGLASGTVGVTGNPMQHLSEFDQKNIARLVKETSKTIKQKSSAELKAMTPEQLKTEMDSVFKPMTIADPSSNQVTGAIKDIERAQQDLAAGVNPEQQNRNIESALNAITGGMSADPMTSAFTKEYGVQSVGDFGSKLVKPIGGKLYQSPLVSAFANAATSSPYYKKLQVAHATASKPKPVAKPKPVKPATPVKPAAVKK